MLISDIVRKSEAKKQLVKKEVLDLMSVYNIKNKKNQQFLRKTVLIITTISLLEKN
jgi:hypothetical protein